jgi:hypothetical protein
MLPKLEQFYLSKPEPQKGCLLALRDLILMSDELVTETVKYGMPCFTYRGKMFAYLWTDKKTKEPYILFVEGKLLDHPMLETGDRARMKIFRVDSSEDLPVELIGQLLQSALDLYRNGVIKIK